MIRAGLGFALLAVQAGLLLPLVVHAIRSRSADGVNLGGEAIWAVAGLGWTLYAIWTHDPVVIASGLLAAAGSAILTSLLWPYTTPGQRRQAVWLSILTVFGLGASTLAGTVGLSVGLSVFGVVQFVPQTITSVRALLSGRPVSGVSRTGAALRTVYTGGWAAYAGAWFWWGITAREISWPLVAWGLMGVLAFGTQALSAARTPRKAGNDAGR